jgi:hypothetical protein
MHSTRIGGCCQVVGGVNWGVVLCAICNFACVIILILLNLPSSYCINIVVEYEFPTCIVCASLILKVICIFENLDPCNVEEKIRHYFSKDFK